MVTSSQKNEAERSCVLKKINIEGEVDEGRQVIVRYETGTLECEGFKSLMALWNKDYERV